MGDEWVADLYQRYGPLVFRRARTLLGNEEAAWDVVREVFVRTLRARADFRHQASPATWLYRITTNYCFNLLRDGARQRGKLRDRNVAAALSPAPPGGDGELRLVL